MSTNAPPRQTPTDPTQPEPPADHETDSTQTPAAQERATAGAQATFSPTEERLPGLFDRQATFCE